MLKQRLITAAILIPLVVWGILKLPTPYLAAVLSLFVVQGAWEWGGLMQLNSRLGRGLFALLVAVGMAMIWLFIDRATTDWLLLPIVSLFWWLLAIAWVLGYPQSTRRWAPRGVQAIVGLLVLLPTWLAVVGVHASGEQGPYLLLYVLILIWVADSGAYFGGRRWGKRKLAPAVSPGKTWEGVISALVLAAGYAMLAAYLFRMPGNLWPGFVVLSLVTVIFSVFGDLAESMFKRHAGVKDSGTLLPGHGGVLDRIDSVTAATPVFVVGLWLADGFGLFVGNGA